MSPNFCVADPLASLMPTQQVKYSLCTQSSTAYVGAVPTMDRGCILHPSTLVYTRGNQLNFYDLNQKKTIGASIDLMRLLERKLINIEEVQMIEPHIVHLGDMDTYNVVNLETRSYFTCHYTCRNTNSLVPWNKKIIMKSGNSLQVLLFLWIFKFIGVWLWRKTIVRGASSCGGFTWVHIMETRWQSNLSSHYH